MFLYKELRWNGDGMGRVKYEIWDMDFQKKIYWSKDKSETLRMFAILNEIYPITLWHIKRIDHLKWLNWFRC